MSRAIDKPPLKVSDLHAFLNRQHQPDSLLVIPYNPGHSTVGGTPAVNVIGIHDGFDWDHGKTLLIPAQPLGIVGDKLQALRNRTNSTNDALFWVVKALTNKRLTDKERCTEARKSIRDHFKSFGEPAPNLGENL